MVVVVIVVVCVDDSDCGVKEDFGEWCRNVNGDEDILVGVVVMM